MAEKYFVRKGAVDPITLTVLAIIAVVVAVKAPSSVPGRDHWWQFWQKNPIVAVQKSQAELDKAKADAAATEAAAVAKIKAENDKQLAGAHEGAVATVNAIEKAQDATAAGHLPVKELETAHSVAVVTKDSLDAATGSVVDPKRVRELEGMVENLNRGIAAGADSLKAMQGALDASVAREKELAAKREADAAAAKAKVDAAEQKTQAATAKAETWALERDAVAKQFENLKFWGFLVVGLIVFLWIANLVLPFASKFFPALAPVAKTAGMVWAPAVQAAHNASASLNADFVGMTEWLKGELAKKSTPEEIAVIKKTMSDDWMQVSDGTAKAVDDIKKTLRL